MTHSSARALLGVLALCMALVWMPGSEAEMKAAALFASLRRARETATEADPKAVKALADATRLVLTELAPLGARQLGLIEEKTVLCSELSTVLHRLLGGSLPQVPLTRVPTGYFAITSFHG